MKILKYAISIIFLLLSSYSIYIINELNVLPNIMEFLVYGIILIINLLSFILLNLKKVIFKIISVILYIVIILISFIVIKYGNETLNFMRRSFNNNSYEITTYDVIVKSSDNYKVINDLANKKIGYLITDINSEDCFKKISVDFKKTDYQDILELYKDFISKKIDAILIDESYLDVIEEEYEDINKDIKIIYSFNIKNNLDIKNVKINELKPINIYISGSDSRSNKIENKSRSDVNMILTINPKTRKILMTSIPRDYYVQVHGQTGLKDKLTHSGIYGIDTSVKTVEDLFDIKIDYYIKISMNSVVELVDLVGGIEIDSDKEFNSYHIKGWKVKKGINQMDGKKALAYSRERYAYIYGDRHRIMNQQQVLEATLKKVVSNKSILLKYDDLLKSLSDLYRTDIPKDIISLLVKNQLDDNISWTFESNSVNGGDGSLPTHTAPNSKRYVMLPYEKDVKEAKVKINNVLNGN